MRDWCAWADTQTDAPSQFHVHGGLLLLSSVVPDGVEIEFGRNREKPNLFVLITGLSGRARKSTSINFARTMLRRLHTERGVPQLWGASFGSFAKMVERLSQRRVQLVIESEFSRMLAQAGRTGYLSDLKTGMTDAFDCTPVSSDTYKHGSVVAENYRLSFGAAVSYDYMSQYGEAEDFTGGFLSRFLIAAADRERFMAVPETGPHIEAMEQAILSQLELIHNHAPSGVYYLSPDAYKLYLTYVCEVEDTAKDATRKIQGIYDRAGLMIRKIATLHAVDRLAREGVRNPVSWELQPRWQITAEDMLPALEVVSAHLAAASTLVRTVENTPEARLRAQVLDAIPTDRAVALGYVTGKVKKGRRAVKSVIEDLIGEGHVTEIGAVSMGARTEMLYTRHDNPVIRLDRDRSGFNLPVPQAENGPVKPIEIPAIPLDVLTKIQAPAASATPATPPARKKRKLTPAEWQEYAAAGIEPPDDDG